MDGMESGKEGVMHARIMDEGKGLRVLSGVYAIRVRSRGYNLLVMEDYLPMLGKLEGNVTFLTKDGEVSMENVCGFYKHQHNEFTLLLEEPQEKAGSEKAQKSVPDIEIEDLEDDGGGSDLEFVDLDQDEDGKRGRGA